MSIDISHELCIGNIICGKLRRYTGLDCKLDGIAGEILGVRRPPVQQEDDRVIYFCLRKRLKLASFHVQVEKMDENM